MKQPQYINYRAYDVLFLSYKCQHLVCLSVCNTSEGVIVGQTEYLQSGNILSKIRAGSLLPHAESNPVHIKSSRIAWNKGGFYQDHANIMVVERRSEWVLFVHTLNGGLGFLLSPSVSTQASVIFHILFPFSSAHHSHSSSSPFIIAAALLTPFGIIRTVSPQIV